MPSFCHAMPLPPPFFFSRRASASAFLRHYVSPPRSFSPPRCHLLATRRFRYASYAVAAAMIAPQHTWLHGYAAAMPILRLRSSFCAIIFHADAVVTIRYCCLRHAVFAYIDSIRAMMPFTLRCCCCCASAWLISAYLATMSPICCCFRLHTPCYAIHIAAVDDISPQPRHDTPYSRVLRYARRYERGEAQMLRGDDADAYLLRE